MSDVQDDVEVQSEASDQKMEDSLQLSRTRLRDLLIKAKSGHASEAIKNMMENKFRISPSIDDVLKYGDVNSLLKVRMNEKLMQDSESSSSSEQIDPVMVLAQSPYSADKQNSQSIHELNKSIDKRITELESLDVNALRLKLIEKSEQLLENTKRPSPIIHQPKHIENIKEYTLIPGKPQKELLSEPEDSKTKIVKPTSKSFSSSKSIHSIDISAIQHQSHITSKSSSSECSKKISKEQKDINENTELKELLNNFTIPSDNSHNQTQSNKMAAKILSQAKEINIKNLQQQDKQINKQETLNSTNQNKKQSEGVKDRIAMQNKILIQRYHNRNLSNIQKNSLSEPKKSKSTTIRSSSTKLMKTDIQPPRCSSQIKMQRASGRSQSVEQQQVYKNDEQTTKNDEQLIQQLNTQILSINQQEQKQRITSKRKKSFSQLFNNMQQNSNESPQMVDNTGLKSKVLTQNVSEPANKETSLNNQSKQDKSPKLVLLESSNQLQKSGSLKKNTLNRQADTQNSIIQQQNQVEAQQIEEEEIDEQLQSIVEQFRTQQSLFTCLRFIIQKYNTNVSNFEILIKQDIYKTIQHTFSTLKEAYIEHKFIQYIIMKRYFKQMKKQYLISSFTNKINFNFKQCIFKLMVEVFIMQLAKWQSSDVKYLAIIQKMQSLRFNNSYEIVRFKKVYSIHNKDDDVITSYKKIQQDQYDRYHGLDFYNSNFYQDSKKAEKVCEEIKESLLKDVIEVEQLDEVKLDVEQQIQENVQQNKQVENKNYNNQDVDDILVQIYNETKITNSNMSQYTEKQYPENSFIGIQETPQFISPKSDVYGNQQADISPNEEISQIEVKISSPSKNEDQHNLVEPKSPLSSLKLPKMASPVLQKQQVPIDNQPHQLGQLQNSQTISSSHSFKEIKFNHLKHESINCKIRLMSQQTQLQMQGHILHYKQIPRLPSKQKIRSVEQIMRERRHILQAHQEIQHYLMRTCLMHWHLLTIKKQKYNTLSNEARKYYQNYLLVISIRSLREEYKARLERQRKIDSARNIINNHLLKLMFYRLKQNIRQQKLVNAKTKYLQRKMQTRQKKTIFYGLMVKSYELTVKYHKYYRKIQKDQQLSIKSTVFYCMKKESAIFRPLIEKVEEYQATINTIRLMSVFQAWQEKTAMIQELQQVSFQILIPQQEQLMKKSFNIIRDKLNSNDQKFQTAYNGRYMFNIFQLLRFKTQDKMYEHKIKYICFQKLLQAYKHCLNEQECILRSDNFRQRQLKAWLFGIMQNYTQKQLMLSTSYEKIQQLNKKGAQKEIFKILQKEFTKRVKLEHVFNILEERFNAFLLKKYFVQLMSIYSLKNNVITEKGQKYLQESSRFYNSKRQFDTIFSQQSDTHNSEKRTKFQALLQQKLVDSQPREVISNPYDQNQKKEGIYMKSIHTNVNNQQNTSFEYIHDPQISEITTKLTQLREMLQSHDDLSQSSLFGQKIVEGLKDSYFDNVKSIVLNSQDKNFVDQVVDQDQLMLSNLTVENKNMPLEQKLQNINNQLRSLMQTDI